MASCAGPSPVSKGRTRVAPRILVFARLVIVGGSGPSLRRAAIRGSGSLRLGRVGSLGPCGRPKTMRYTRRARTFRSGAGTAGATREARLGTGVGIGTKDPPTT